MICNDAALKEYMRYLSESGAVPGFHVVESLDDRHLLVQFDGGMNDARRLLQIELDKWHDENSYYSMTEEEKKKKRYMYDGNIKAAEAAAAEADAVAKALTQQQQQKQKQKQKQNTAGRK